MKKAILREDLRLSNGEIEGYVYIHAVTQITCAIELADKHELPIKPFNALKAYEYFQPEGFGIGLNSGEGFNIVLVDDDGIYLANSLDFDFIDESHCQL